MEFKQIEQGGREFWGNPAIPERLSNPLFLMCVGYARPFRKRKMLPE
jgi:hypothetical protein